MWKNKVILVGLYFGLTITITVLGKQTGNWAPCDITIAETWHCHDGQCLPLASLCDGRINCIQGDDETFVNCRNNTCAEGMFRCAYGACINSSLVCNQESDCVDNSDEVLARCQNDDGINCAPTFTSGMSISFTCWNMTENCDSGQTLNKTQWCDGKVDCTDGSDETVARCAETVCSPDVFRCAYGGCAHSKAQCNGVEDCADASDESEELCGKRLINATALAAQTPKPPVRTGPCVLPPYPHHGTYSVIGEANSEPGQPFNYTSLNVTCEPGFGLTGRNDVFCILGTWSEKMPKCVPYCKLEKHHSVEYRCVVSKDGLDGLRPCREQELSGVEVQPQCRAPNYHAAGLLPLMRCRDGVWNYIAQCQPECGLVTPKGKALVAGGKQAELGELPWHVGIYKLNQTYEQICGGSIVSNTVVISAAHCFWTDRLQDASLYAIAAGKLYRKWDDTRDTGAQYTNVTSINVPKRYSGVLSNFQSDLAILIATTSFEFKTHIRPVCVDFDTEFESLQLRQDSKGKIAGWGLVGTNDSAAEVLQVVQLPYINVIQCLEETPVGFKEYITSDKICAGYTNGTAVCRGDSGGGLSFPAAERARTRYYLRGVVSTAPAAADGIGCNIYTYATFTQITNHKHFIKHFI